METVKSLLTKIARQLYSDVGDIDVTRPDTQFGDFTTNLALQLARPLGKNPREIAELLVNALMQQKPGWLDRAEIAGPGFINIWITDAAVAANVNDVLSAGDSYGKSDVYKGQKILVEYLDPNPFKEIHIGHAYSGTVGDAIAHLFESAGGDVSRVTYQGDVGLHVAKSLYGILARIQNDPARLDAIPEPDRAAFLGETYTAGAAAYETDESAKQQIHELNKKIYEQTDELIKTVYETGKTWSLQYFNDVYARFNFSPFVKNYMEGMVAAEGLQLVRDHIDDGVFTVSDGAVVFDGERHGLHTRVFINSQGLPTYEAKDLGNAMLKWRDFSYDKSIIITAEEQSEYFKVMLKALEQFAPEQAARTLHIAHGMVRLSSGKMSSRTGKVVRALDLLESAESAARAVSTSDTAPIHENALAAIKYTFLKNRIGGDITYDVNESVSLEGNSGPYLQYSYARAQSILRKAAQPVERVYAADSLNQSERILASKLGVYPEVVERATQDLMPHHICTYLYELAQMFNQFYEQNKVIGSQQESARLTLVAAYAVVLKNGLELLRIPAPERM